MVIVGTLLPHFCKLSRDSFNFFKGILFAVCDKKSLDRNASALPDPEVLFSRVGRHLACLAFCKLKVGIFQRSLPFND